jgi:hypothetical protein
MLILSDQPLSSLTVSQILSFNADNATPNDKQTDIMATLQNSFEKENRLRCFSHTLQLSANTLVGPFNAGMKPVRNDELIGAMASDANDANDADDVNDADGETSDLESEDDEGDDESDTGADANEMDEGPDDGIDELDQLEEEERNQILEDTRFVPVCQSYAISHSRSSIQQHLHSRRGATCAPSMDSNKGSYLATS